MSKFAPAPGGASITYSPTTVAGHSAAGQAAGWLSTTLAGTVSWAVLAGALAVSSGGVLTTTGLAPNSGAIAAAVSADNGTDGVIKHISVPVSTYTPPAIPAGKHLFVGDSTTEGVSINSSAVSTSTWETAPAARYAYWLNQAGTAARYDCASFLGDPDLRPASMTVPSDWSAGSGFLEPGSSTASLTWTTTYSARAFDIYYRDVFNSVMTIQIGTDTPITLNCGSTNQTKKFTVTTPTAAVGKQLKLTGVSGSIRLFALEAYNPDVADVRVVNLGIGGAGTSTWVGDDVAGPRAVAQAFQATRYYINLGINDAGGGLALSTFYSNLSHIGSQLLANVATGGEVILEVPTPTNGTANAATQMNYETQILNLAAAGPYRSINLRAHFVSYAAMNGNGYIYDTLHPTIAGYDNEGQYLAGQPQA